MEQRGRRVANVFLGALCQVPPCPNKVVLAPSLHRPDTKREHRHQSHLPPTYCKFDTAHIAPLGSGVAHPRWVVDPAAQGPCGVSSVAETQISANCGDIGSLEPYP